VEQKRYLSFTAVDFHRNGRPQVAKCCSLFDNIPEYCPGTTTIDACFTEEFTLGRRAKFGILSQKIVFRENGTKFADSPAGRPFLSLPLFPC
jgi:hypothetical protein